MPQLYTKGDLTEDDTSGDVYGREILDPEGICICRVIEHKNDEKLYPGATSADILIIHLNRGTA